MSMADDLKNSKCNGYKKGEEPCPCEKCICEGDKICYNNKNCCYLQPKDVSITQINDPTLFQVITSLDNLYLSAIPLEINTSGYIIESSSIQRPNDTLIVDELGVYSVYVSLKYRFKFNESAKEGDIFRIEYEVNGNNKEIFTMENTITVPEIIDGESREIINTIQGKKLQIVEDQTLKINIALKRFDFDLAVLNQIIITDLILIVEKVI